MTTTELIDQEDRSPAIALPSGGFADQAVRLERRLGWVLWGALLTLLVLIST